MVAVSHHGSFFRRLDILSMRFDIFFYFHSNACCSIFRAPSWAIRSNTDQLSLFSVQKSFFYVYCFISISLSFGNIFGLILSKRYAFFIFLSTTFDYISIYWSSRLNYFLYSSTSSLVFLIHCFFLILFFAIKITLH